MIPPPQPVENPGNNRVFYQILVGSFSDSNGDGIGDLQGYPKHMNFSLDDPRVQILNGCFVTVVTE